MITWKSTIALFKNVNNEKMISRISIRFYTAIIINKDKMVRMEQRSVIVKLPGRY